MRFREPAELADASLLLMLLLLSMMAIGDAEER